MTQPSPRHSRPLVIIVHLLTMKTLAQVLECGSGLAPSARIHRSARRSRMKSVQRRLMSMPWTYMIRTQTMVGPLRVRVMFLHVRRARRGIVEIAWRRVPIPVAGADTQVQRLFRTVARGVQTHYSLAPSHLRRFLNHTPYLPRRCRLGTLRGWVDKKGNHKRVRAGLVPAMLTSVPRQSTAQQVDETKSREPRDDMNYSRQSNVCAVVSSASSHDIKI